MQIGAPAQRLNVRVNTGRKIHRGFQSRENSETYWTVCGLWKATRDNWVLSPSAVSCERCLKYPQYLEAGLE